MMINFLSVYWRDILSALAIVVSIVLLVIKKKPVKVVDTIKEVICRLLPGLILDAERIYQVSGLGEAKAQYVLDLLVKVLKEFGYGDDVISQYLPFMADQLEAILSTPQKKVR